MNDLLYHINNLKVYQMIEVEILPENSIIYTISMEDDVSIYITKYYEFPDDNPFVTVFQDKKVIFHGDVPLDFLIEKINNTWSKNSD